MQRDSVDIGVSVEATVGTHTDSPTNVTGTITERIPPRDHEVDVAEMIVALEITDILDDHPEADEELIGDTYLKFASDVDPVE